MAHNQDTFGFKAVLLLKDQVLGIGSYGKVCRAKCDNLLCAAKLIHETLFDPLAQHLIVRQREHRLPIRRFEQECQFLSTIRHPNIVQYLGIYQDPDTGLPALLMELMDDSLTHFLESSTQPIRYHIQINICHDITLALSFLHSNDIVHRDLSSNNVLLIGSVRAKVTDFGMARLGVQSTQLPQLTFTMCPGTDVFMPPEAVQDKPVYTEKIDCFSFGVISLQILTRKFPKPGDRRRQIHVIDQPGMPNVTVAEVLIPETERRQNHIAEVDPNHSLLHIIFDCIKDKEFERPSADELCERVLSLKECQEYSESVRGGHKRSSCHVSLEAGGDERDREHAEQVLELQQLVRLQACQLEEKSRLLRQKEERIAAMEQQLHNNYELERERNTATDKIERVENRPAHQLEENEHVISQYRRRIHEIGQPVPGVDAAAKDRQASDTDSCRTTSITWREGGKAPCVVSTPHNAVSTGNELYIRTASCEVYAYTTSISTWTRLPDSPTQCCPSAITNGLLTLVGGLHGGSATNQLFSLSGEGFDRRWTEILPRMPTKRYSSTALSAGTLLIVAGGLNGFWTENQLQAVEVLNTETLQWSAAANLPQPRTCPPGAVCGNHVYILSRSTTGPKLMYMCSISDLIQSCGSRHRADVWNRVTAPPVTATTCVSINDQLVAIGGADSNRKPSTAIYIYDPTSDSWEIINHMVTPRINCCAAVLASNQLVIVGGRTESGKSDSVEIATVE